LKKRCVLPEITSNLYYKKFVPDFDSVLSTVSATEINLFQPDLLITIGGSFISKRIKLWLRKHPPKVHWHIDEIDYHLDTFQHIKKLGKIEQKKSSINKQSI